LTVEPIETFSRIGCLSSAYADAAEKGYCDYLKCTEEIEKFSYVEFDEDLVELKHLKQIAGLNTIVFSAMCFEASIFDFASVHLGDDYVKDNLDKLDTLSKWVVVLRFVSGVELRKDEAPYGLLKTLIAARNKLVHAKSEQFGFCIEDQIKQIDKARKQDEEYESNIHIALRALVTMSLYLDVAHNGHHNPLPAYDKTNAPMRRYYPQLKNVIGQCHKTISKIEIS
jgi:hypothetical protein